MVQSVGVETGLLKVTAAAGSFSAAVDLFSQALSHNDQTRRVQPQTALARGVDDRAVRRAKATNGLR